MIDEAYIIKGAHLFLLSVLICIEPHSVPPDLDVNVEAVRKGDEDPSPLMVSLEFQLSLLELVAELLRTSFLSLVIFCAILSGSLSLAFANTHSLSLSRTLPLCVSVLVSRSLSRARCHSLSLYSNYSSITEDGG